MPTANLDQNYRVGRAGGEGGWAGSLSVVCVRRPGNEGEGGGGESGN